MLILAEDVVYSTERLNRQCMVAVRNIEVENVVMEIAFLKK